jgi:hypothetical protein
LFIGLIAFASIFSLHYPLDEASRQPFEMTRQLQHEQARGQFSGATAEARQQYVGVDGVVAEGIQQGGVRRRAEVPGGSVIDLGIC